MVGDRMVTALSEAAQWNPLGVWLTAGSILVGLYFAARALGLYWTEFRATRNRR